MVLIGHADEENEIVKEQPWNFSCVCYVGVCHDIAWELEKTRKLKQYKKDVVDMRSLSSRDNC